MQALDRFLSPQYTDRQIEYKPDLDKIASYNIPQPLKDLYLFISKYLDKNGTFGKQDTLIINSGKGDCTGKLYKKRSQNNATLNCSSTTL